MEKQKRVRAPKKWIVWMGALAGVTIIVSALSYVFLGPDEQPQEGRAKIVAMRPKANDTVGGSPSTDSYNVKLKKYNDMKVEEAKKNRSSVVPTVVGEKLKRPNVKKIEPDNEPKEIKPLKRVPMKKAPKPAKSASRPKRRGPDEMEKYRASVRTKIKTILSQELEYQPHATISFIQEAEAGAGNARNPQASDKAAEQPPLPFKQGDLLYSANIIHINSDVPSPVAAEIVSGAYKGAQFFGSYQRHQKWLLLRFTELKTPDGNVYKIDAIALDSETNSAAIRSRVDSHYLERWGGIIAASFLEGFGEAVGKSGVNETSTDFENTLSYPEYDVHDQAWIAAGRVGERLAKIMESNFSRPPTVYADTKDMFAIMILSAKK